MKWKIEFTPRAEKQLSNLDKPVRDRTDEFLDRRVSLVQDPRFFAMPMQGLSAGRWRLRVGDYRLISRIHAAIIKVEVIAIGHRREVYD